MRLLLCAIVFLSCVSLAYAETPVPTKKPLSQNNFESVLENAVKKEEVKIPRPPILQVSLEHFSIITPPPLPERKRVTSRPTETALVIDGIPIPDRKPFKIKIATAPKATTPAPVQPNLIPYQGSIDDRTASRGRTIERVPAKRAPRITETSEKSPFKTAKLPRAGQLSTHDPVIIFFKEKTSELEVGQLDIIKSDILTRMKRSPTKKIAVYGYAERNRNNPDKTNQLSLSRALLISEYLADNRIDASRIEARSMGNDTPISPKNRVDAVIF